MVYIVKSEARAHTHTPTHRDGRAGENPVPSPPSKHKKRTFINHPTCQVSAPIIAKVSLSLLSRYYFPYKTMNPIIRPAKRAHPTWQRSLTQSLLSLHTLYYFSYKDYHPWQQFYCLFLLQITKKIFKRRLK